MRHLTFVVLLLAGMAGSVASSGQIQTNSARSQNQIEKEYRKKELKNYKRESRRESKSDIYPYAEAGGQKADRMSKKIDRETSKMETAEYAGNSHKAERLRVKMQKNADRISSK